AALIAAQVQRGRATTAVTVENHGVILVGRGRDQPALSHAARLEIADYFDLTRAAAGARDAGGIFQVGERQCQPLLRIVLGRTGRLLPVEVHDSPEAEGYFPGRYQTGAKTVPAGAAGAGK